MVRPFGAGGMAGCTASDQGFRAVSPFGMFGLTPANLGVPSYWGNMDPGLKPGNNLTYGESVSNDGDVIAKQPFMVAYATSHQDWQDGFICARTGYWAPGRYKTVVKGQNYITEFAPVNEETRYSYRYPRVLD